MAALLFADLHMTPFAYQGVGDRPLAGTFRIGRLFGFNISVHWTWFFFLFLLTWTFANGVLDEFYTDWTDGRKWTVAAAITLVFFLSIFIHEISHGVVARRFGIKVSDVTLFVFGGVSSLSHEPRDSRQEFWIAVVGPFTSFALSIAFTVGYFALRLVDDGVAAVSGNLAVLNLLIGLFNVIPGFPLDGGRVMRSAFWAKRRNLVEATRAASNISMFVAYGMMAAGIVMFFTASIVSGIWLLLIGIFLRAASVESYERVFLDIVLRGVPASSVARQDYVSVPPDLSLQELIEENVLAGYGRCFPVVVGDDLIGLVTLHDVRTVPREEWTTTSVFRVMTPYDDLRSVSMLDDLPTVLSVMAAMDVNQVPLMEGRLLLGLIHRSDVIRYIQVRQEILPAA
jgi:Zn-dependent protease/predicted transcriptional regulator